MRVAVTSTGEKLTDQVDWRFGRCRYFVVVDPNSAEIVALENEGSAAGGGAGVRAAQRLADQEADAVITGHCGPKAFQALQAAGIAVYTGADGTVEATVERYVAGELVAITESTVQSHTGTEGGA